MKKNAAKKRPKLTVRPTKEELERLHERAASFGYDSLSAYLIDAGLREGGALPRERRTLESLLLHVRLLTFTVEQEKGGRKSAVLNSVPRETLVDIARRAAEALRLINVILGRAAEGEVGVAEEAA